MSDHPTEQVDRVVEALVNADKPAWRDTLAWYRAMACAALDAAPPPVLKKGYDPARDCLVIEVPAGSVGERDQ